MFRTFTLRIVAATAIVFASVGISGCQGNAVATERDDTPRPPIGNPYPGHCPLTGAVVNASRAAASPELHSEFEGKRYLFCCAACKPRFEADPRMAIAHPSAPKPPPVSMGMGHHHH